LIPDPIVESEIEKLRDVDSLALDFFEWTRTTLQSPRIVRRAVLNVADPLQSIVPNTPRNVLAYHSAKPLLPYLSYHALRKVVVLSVLGFDDVVVDEVFANVRHEFSLSTALFLGAVEGLAAKNR
jgi:hypothetical protein